MYFFRLSILLLFFLGAAAQATPAQVLLLRHAEKPAHGNELSEKGWERAKALPLLFRSRPEFRAHGSPVALYAMSPKHKRGSIRAVETLGDLAKDLKLPIHSDFVRSDVQSLVREIMKRPEYDGKLVVVCWEHVVLRKIAKVFGVKKPPKYPGSRYDRVWLLTFTGKKHPRFSDLPQTLLPGDAKK